MNKIKLLGFLGFLGLLGIWTKNYGFFGFFGFFSFFAATSKQDERLNINVYKAGFNGFVASLIGISLLVTAHSMETGLVFIAIITAVIFIIMILIFVISLILYEKKGLKV
ncbi:MAG: DUF3796 domain-containing protein [Nanobdellota archaeon]